MNRDWPIYNPEATCPKCAFADVSSLYRDGWQYRFPGSSEGEWIERSCLRCQYRWPEECAP